MWNEFANDTCLPDPSAPCSAAGYPAYVVNATSAVDVKAGIDFAREHNIRVSVKSTGHDYLGRSVAPGSLSIWTHHMRGLKTHTSFRPKGCPFTIDGSAVTASGGSEMYDLYSELDKINQTVVGGGAKSVGLGGYLTGGGHSILAPHFGLAADQVLEMEVVTPGGDIVTANECRNRDLFWAMRGGGGGTFGVMTSVTLITHPSPQLLALSLRIGTLDVGSPDLWDVIGYVLSQFPYLDSRGVTGYTFFKRNATFPVGDNATMQVSGIAGTLMVIGTQDPADGVSIFDPIVAHVGETWPAYFSEVTATPYPSFLAWFDDYYDAGGAGFGVYVGSRLVDADALTANVTAVSEAYSVFAADAGSAYLVAGRGVRDAKPRGGGNAVVPAWRKAIAHSTNGRAVLPLNVTDQAVSLELLNASVEPLRKLAPDMGAYMNENNPGEPDWQHAFWGANYDRLVSIKRKLDPHDVLWCHPCVGNERWEQVGYKLCRV